MGGNMIWLLTTESRCWYNVTCLVLAYCI